MGQVGRVRGVGLSGGDDEIEVTRSKHRTSGIAFDGGAFSSYGRWNFREREFVFGDFGLSLNGIFGTGRLWWNFLTSLMGMFVCLFEDGAFVSR